MWRELDIGGVLLPPLLAYAAAAGLAYIPLRMALNRVGFWRWTWNQPVAEMGIYMGLLAVLSHLL